MVCEAFIALFGRGSTSSTPRQSPLAQTLMVTAGRDRTQYEGEPIVEICAGELDRL